MDFGLIATEEIHNKLFDEADGLDADYFPIVSL